MTEPMFDLRDSTIQEGQWMKYLMDLRPSEVTDIAITITPKQYRSLTRDAAEWAGLDNYGAFEAAEKKMDSIASGETKLYGSIRVVVKSPDTVRT